MYFVWIVVFIYLLIFCLPELKPDLRVGMDLTEHPFLEHLIFSSLTWESPFMLKNETFF